MNLHIYSREEILALARRARIGFRVPEPSGNVNEPSAVTATDSPPDEATRGTDTNRRGRSPRP